MKTFKYLAVAAVLLLCNIIPFVSAYAWEEGMHWTHNDFSKYTLKNEAIAGNAEAQYVYSIYLEKYYMFEWDEKPNDEIVFWLKKAASQNHPEALYDLGLLYNKGEKVEADQDLAIAYLKKSADLGYPKAQNSMGLFFYYEKDNKQEAFEWFSKAAHQDNISAQMNLGVMYRNGEVVDKDHNQAFKWYKKAADQRENPFASARMAFIYGTGDLGIEADYDRAKKYIKEAISLRFPWSYDDIDKIIDGYKQVEKNAMHDKYYVVE